MTKSRQKYLNQYTSPPLTEDELIGRCRDLVAHGDGKGGGNDHDWLGLFTEWLHSEPSEHKNVGAFLVSKGIHKGTIQKRGGRTMWNHSRDIVRAQALIKSIENAPDKWAAKLDKEMEVSLIGISAVEKYFKRAMQDPEPPVKPGEGATPDQIRVYGEELKEYKRQMRLIPSDALKTLSDAFTNLATELSKLREAAKPGIHVGVNMFPILSQAIKDRDAQFRVVDP